MPLHVSHLCYRLIPRIFAILASPTTCACDLNCTFGMLVSQPTSAAIVASCYFHFSPNILTLLSHQMCLWPQMHFWYACFAAHLCRYHGTLLLSLLTKYIGTFESPHVLVTSIALLVCLFRSPLVPLSWHLATFTSHQIYWHFWVTKCACDLNCTFGMLVSQPTSATIVAPLYFHFSPNILTLLSHSVGVGYLLAAKPE